MTKQIQELKKRGSNVFGILAGLLVGGLAGGITMLLLAPQTGKEVREQIQKKGLELRDRTAEIVEDAMSQVRSSASKITTTGYEKIKELKQQGQDLAVDQLDRVADVVQTGKKAIQSS